MSWNQAEELAEKHSSGGRYLRLENDGDKAVGVFCGEPRPREVVWTGTGYVEADSDEGKRLIQRGKKASLKVSINFYCLEDRAMRIYEMGTQTFKKVVGAKTKYGVESNAFEVVRRGAKGSNKTYYEVMYDHALSDAELRDVTSANLHDLARGDQQDGDALVDEDLARTLLRELEQVGIPAAKKILAKLGVNRVRELRGCDVEQLREEIETINVASRDDDGLL